MGSKFISLILFFLFNLAMNSQELPPVVNYGPNEYQAGNQNWMIAQAPNKDLYFANSTGLLEYNGENWNLYPVPNNTIVRSVKVVNGRIYTGAYMEAGYWQKNKYGKLEYTSLIPRFKEGVNDGEQFWDIEFLDGLVIFRSFAGVYFYNPAENLVTKMANPYGMPVSGIFKLNDELYFQLVTKGLFKIKNGIPELVVPYELLGDRAVMHLYRKNDQLRIITGNSDFFYWDGSEFIQFNKKLSSDLGNPNIFDAINLENGGLVLGTVGDGVIQIDGEGNIKNKISQENTLLNNTVLDLFLDGSGNIWAGLDYGISSIDLNSAFRSYQDNQGEIGSVYASFQERNNLYLGTNQGLYVRNSNEGFRLIEGTKGQVWFIDQVGDYIFCGHNSGTFLIEDGRALKVSDRLGTWVVKKFSEGIFIQGHYNGISFLKKTAAGFESLPMIQDFPHSSKFIEIEDDSEVWVSNEHKGVFKLKMNDSLNKIKESENYKFTEESGITSSLFRFNDSLYYSSVRNIYQYKKDEDKFTRENRLNRKIADHNRISGKMISEKNGKKLWGFGTEGIFSIKPASLSNEYDLDLIYIDQDFRNIAVGYENIEKLNEEEYLLGIANGYLKFGQNPATGSSEIDIKLNKVENSALDAAPQLVSLNEQGEFSFKNNNLSFSYSVPQQDKYLEPVYSYRLLGLSSNWSSWNPASEARFNNLNFGEYTFEVKGKVGDQVTGTASYNFNISRPAYLSSWAIFGYFLLFLLLLYAIHILNRRHHQKMVKENERALKMKNLEAEQEIIKLKNEKLEQEMAGKNKELAVSTMSLIKKNEFLSSIKEKLKDSEAGSSKVESVIKTIDKDISEEDNWKFFKKAFNNADKDFFKKVREKHPNLTSNDLKLCAYLRLNLSSKEIAPLLNISVKSVEIKRYRLRKKMDLDRETNLTDYILSL